MTKEYTFDFIREAEMLIQPFKALIKTYLKPYHKHSW